MGVFLDIHPVLLLVAGLVFAFVAWAIPDWGGGFDALRVVFACLSAGAFVLLFIGRVYPKKIPK